MSDSTITLMLTLNYCSEFCEDTFWASIQKKNKEKYVHIGILTGSTGSSIVNCQFSEFLPCIRLFSSCSKAFQRQILRFLQLKSIAHLTKMFCPKMEPARQLPCTLIHVCCVNIRNIFFLFLFFSLSLSLSFVLLWLRLFHVIGRAQRMSWPSFPSHLWTMRVKAKDISFRTNNDQPNSLFWVFAPFKNACMCEIWFWNLVFTPPKTKRDSFDLS